MALSPASPGGPTAKLEHVTERFANLWTDLEAEKQNRRQQEMTRMQILQESIIRLEKSLESEIKRRADSDKQLQNHFEGELRALQERTAIQIADLQNSLKGTVDTFSNRIQDLHALVKEERGQRNTDIEHLATSLVGKVNECVAAIEDERNTRIADQTAQIKRFGDDILGMQQRLDQERVHREAELVGLRAEVHDALANRNSGDDQFKSAVLDEVSNLKAALQLEREERVAEDDEIVQAINDYTKALQEGLKLVNAT